MLTPSIYYDLRQRINDHDTQADDIMRMKNGKSYAFLTAAEAATLPQVSNAERSAVEVYEFIERPPETYFLYINRDQKTAATWTGDVLGQVTFGCAFRSNMGDKRIPITIRAINGHTYHGTFFASAGGYARVKMKHQRIR